MAIDERIQELISAYSLGVLEGDDLREVEEFKQNHPDQFEELVKENELAFSQLTYAVKGAMPNSGLKKKLMSAIKEENKQYQQEPALSFLQRLQPFWLNLGAAVAAIAIVALVTYNFTLTNKLESRQAFVANLQNQVAAKQTEIENLEKESILNRQMVAFLEDPNVVIINLVNTQPDLTAVGRVLWNTKDDQAMFCGINLPQPPEGKTYQLWAIGGGDPKSAGIFDVNDKGKNVLMLQSLNDLGKIKQFAVSLEPAGGVTLPTGKIYLSGEI
ncbi:MAG: anti-sigma factor [Thermodesulfobacteriota bacterium]